MKKTARFSGKKSAKLKTSEYSYREFKKINGDHSLKKTVPESVVEYRARKRKGGKVLYFNFNLAKEMGLIPKKHPHKLNNKLAKEILESFSIVIINEYDEMNGAEFPKKEIKPKTYMATRYLQLQHPSKVGLTSGDGRSIWNGQFSKNGLSWDISSCGTGATSLSPATAIQKKFFKTGDPSVSYGCGYADASDGISAAVLSEVFHRNGIKTERTLAVIEYEHGTSVNVRAGKNLLRPSHFFNHLKQGNYDELKRIVDLYIERQIYNGNWPQIRKSHEKYDYLLKDITETFSKIIARFENDYIFCWLDWDGDNILTDGGIIDYGSVRQFGLYHHEYRYDDVQRMSTTIPEQKKKAKYIVQTFAQLVNYLKTKKKKSIKSFANCKSLKDFESIYTEELNVLFLKQIGLKKGHQDYLIKNHHDLVQKFQKVFRYFEKTKSKRGLQKVPDGINWNAVFCMRDILRELPQILHKRFDYISDKEFIEILKSNYASKAVTKLTPFKKKQVRAFQRYYMEMVRVLSIKENKPVQGILIEVMMRASVINRYERVTGDAIIHISDKILKEAKKCSSEDFHYIIEDFVNENVHFEDNYLVSTHEKPTKKAKKLKDKLVEITKDYRYSL